MINFDILATSFIQDGKELTSWKDKIHYNRRDLVLKDVYKLINAAYRIVSEHYSYHPLRNCQIIITASSSNYSCLLCHNVFNDMFLKDLIEKEYDNVSIKESHPIGIEDGIYCDIVAVEVGYGNSYYTVKPEIRVGMNF